MSKYLLKFALRNVFRNKRRTVLTAVVIMISVGSFLFMFSYIKGVRDSIVEDSVKLTGHISVQHPEYSVKERMLSLSVPVHNYAAIRDTLQSMESVTAAAGRIKFGGLIDFREKNEPGVGYAIDSAIEEGIIDISESLVSGTGFSEGDDRKNELLIGSELALSLDIQPGDTVTVVSRTAYNSLTAVNLVVTGIVDMLSGAMNKLFYMHLETAQYFLDMDDSVSEIAVFLQENSDEELVKNFIESTVGISGTYRVTTWLDKGILRDYLPMLDTANAFIILIFGLIAALGIINTMLMAVFERTREIGVFSAFGMKRRDILAVFLFEALSIGCVGGFAGVVLGGYWAIFLEINGLSLGTISESFSIPVRTVIYSDFRIIHGVSAFALGLAMSVLAAFLPAVKAARMEPTDALRTH